MTDAAQTLRVSHATRYTYAEKVSLSYHQAMLLTRDTVRQRVEGAILRIEPEVRNVVNRVDYFGNNVSLFEIDSGHTNLEVVAESLVQISSALAPDLTTSLPMEEISALLSAPLDVALQGASEYLAASPFIPKAPELAGFAKQHFPPGRPYLDGVRELTRRIFREFRYDREATCISTPVRDVLDHKHGVCQDFAHLMIACLRSLGGPARYVSGYLTPLPGVVGAQFSHAWVSAYCPRLGWVDFDPTNDMVPNGGHITLAWGRDFSDVSPLRGVIFGGGDHVVQVAVNISTNA
jgi:transglutaminase-like putative cysteine protease